MINAADTATRPLINRSQLTDAAFAVALVVLGVLGFRTSFGGQRFLIVGVVGALVGAAAAYGVLRAKLSPLVAAASLVVVFGVTGACAVPDAAPAGFLPSPEAVAALGDGLANSWIKLLTSQTPAGAKDNLMVAPFFCAFLGSALSIVLAEKVRRFAVCVIPPVLVLAVSVLLGISKPANLLLQGGVFGAVAIAWIARRSRLTTTVVGSSFRASRAVAGVALLGVSLLGATVVGPHLPGSGSNRFVLRDKFQPPFDPRDYPSPLSRFRNYVLNEKSTPLFAIEGLPSDVPLRLAVMDTYDGVVWSVAQSQAGATTTAANEFKRFGEVLPGAAPGDSVKLRVDVAGYRNVWTPTVGSPNLLEFVGDDAIALQQSYRFNRASEAAATPRGLTEGVGYKLNARLPATERPADNDAFAMVGVGNDAVKLADDLVKPFQDAVAAGKTDYQRAKLLEDAFTNTINFYDPVTQKGTPGVPLGHALVHVSGFLRSRLSTGGLLGNEEHYASAMAVVARQLGMPARVVFGFRDHAEKGRAAWPGANGRTTVTGNDADAWVEIAFGEAGWVAFHPTPDRDHRTNLTPTLTKRNQNESEAVDPPVTVPPPRVNSIEQAKATSNKSEDTAEESSKWLGVITRIAKIAAIPIVATSTPLLLLILAKALRRRRRRSRGAPAQRIAGGWHESLDLARDLGHAVPRSGLTRVEATQLVAVDELAALASMADASSFGPSDPTDEHAARYWQHVDKLRAESLAPLSRWQRIKVLANPTSLFASAPSFALPKIELRRLGGLRLRRKAA